MLWKSSLQSLLKMFFPAVRVSILVWQGAPLVSMIGMLRFVLIWIPTSMHVLYWLKGRSKGILMDTFLSFIGQVPLPRVKVFPILHPMDPSEALLSGMFTWSRACLFISIVAKVSNNDQGRFRDLLNPPVSDAVERIVSRTRGQDSSGHHKVHLEHFMMQHHKKTPVSFFLKYQSNFFWCRFSRKIIWRQLWYLPYQLRPSGCLWT